MFKSKLTKEQTQELREFLEAHPDLSLKKVASLFCTKFGYSTEDIVLASIQIEFEAPPPD